jgi:hypothetical protein
MGWDGKGCDVNRRERKGRRAKRREEAGEVIGE